MSDGTLTNCWSPTIMKTKSDKIHDEARCVKKTRKRFHWSPIQTIEDDKQQMLRPGLECEDGTTGTS